MGEKEALELFAREYGELCQKYGIQIVGSPVWVPTNHGTFEIAVKLEAVRFEQKAGDR